MTPPERYLSLLKSALLNELNIEVEARLVCIAHDLLQGQPLDPRKLIAIRETPFWPILKQVRQNGGTLTLKQPLPNGQRAVRNDLRFLSENCHTMMGRKRLDHLHDCLDVVCREEIPGDFIETGVWRGGGTIFMRGFLAAHAIADRAVWVADSFEGLPVPSLEQDQGWDLSKEKWPSLAVGLDEVKELFTRYDLLDEQVRFLPGWFRDTLPQAPIRALAVLRLDGDLYESTMDALQHLYEKVQPGGFVIVDDYHSIDPCRQAVDEFRARRNDRAPLQSIDSEAVFWRKA